MDIATACPVCPYAAQGECGWPAPVSPGGAGALPDNKTSKVLSRIQKRFKVELNSWSPFVDRLFWQTQTNRTLGDQLLSYFRASSFLIFTTFLDGGC
jgi:hypothetical protein